MNGSAKGVVAPSSNPDEMLIGRITEHEGIKKFAYTDILGYITVGVGRCLDAKVGKGLSIDEIFYLLRNDIKEFRNQLGQFEWFVMQDEVRRGVLVELAFNMGIPHLLQFKKMIGALTIKNYPLACKELMDSIWATQVGKSRSDDICYRLKNGRYK